MAKFDFKGEKFPTVHNREQKIKLHGTIFVVTGETHIDWFGNICK